jgi:hypothetical protein
VEYQLRIYSVKPNAMEQWIEEWRDHLAPLRRNYGFEVTGAWVIEAENKFVWILAHEHDRGFEAADAAYYASDERKALAPDPARHLLTTEHWMMRLA